MMRATSFFPKFFLLYLIAVTLASLYQVAHSLKITGLVVPHRMQSGDRARFSCYFSLEGHTLHSLTWTKDDLPFFRYRYGDALEDEATSSSNGVETLKTESLTELEAHKITYEVPGITVDKQGSTLNEVSLSRVDHRASGTIGCRVRAQQHNSSDKWRSDITVFDLPQHGPQIEGQSPGTELDEMLYLNCTSPPAHPPVTLGWTINGQEAADTFVTNYPGLPDGEGLIASVTGLSFSLHKEDFLGDGVLKIRCSASFMEEPALFSEMVYLKEEVRKTLKLWHDEHEDKNWATQLNIRGPTTLLRVAALLVCFLFQLTGSPLLVDSTQCF